ncbi:MAG: sigma-54 dependent transcriptional regulator [Planctomycetes bacterium]|nr:sigma-54 dependent transcriptional regulator [Planctomycetota bacterium]
MAQILVVDDERSLLEMIEILLTRSGHQVMTAPSADAALTAFRERSPELVLLDLRLGGESGLDVLRAMKAHDPLVPVIVITAYSTWDNAVQAMRLGAYDFIKKPFEDNDHVREVVSRALAQRATLSRSERRDAAAEILGNSPAIRDALDVLKRVAPTDSTVLITGESGTGKELLARAVHYTSLRAGGPFLSVNCGAFSETLLESELFGHLRGAFSGAYVDKKGLIEVCDQGTFFLDEVGELSPSTQVKLLRVLEERRILPVGGTSPRKVDVRFICATNKDLELEVAHGRFRADLFYRINVLPIRLPALRDRKKDIPLLAAHFLARYSRKQGKSLAGIALEAQQRLEAHDWPGNVRELENTIQRAVTLCQGDHVGPEHLLLGGGGAPRPSSALAGGAAAPFTGPVELPAGGMDLEAALADIERQFIQAALVQTHGHLTNAAKLLGITFRAIRYKVKKYELDRLALRDE